MPGAQPALHAPGSVASSRARQATAGEDRARCRSQERVNERRLAQRQAIRLPFDHRMTLADPCFRLRTVRFAVRRRRCGEKIALLGSVWCKHGELIDSCPEDDRIAAAACSPAADTRLVQKSCAVCTLTHGTPISVGTQCNQ